MFYRLVSKSNIYLIKKDGAVDQIDIIMRVKSCKNILILNNFIYYHISKRVLFLSQKIFKIKKAISRQFKIVTAFFY